jgi:TRAP-type C4-dicarboxylate transport system permease small subunit
MNRLARMGIRLIEGLLVLLLGLMVVLVFGNVVLRYVANSGITVSEELSRWFFVWMTFLGAVIGLRERAHLGTDLLIGRLGRNGKRACLLVSQVFMLWVTWLIFKGSLEQTGINWTVEAPVSELSMAWLSGVGLVFAALTAPMLLLDLWRTLTGQIRDADLVMVQESEDLAHVQGMGPEGSASSAPVSKR